MSTQENRARFEKLAAARTNKAIKAIQLVANCANKRDYEYTDDEFKSIISALNSEMSILKAAYKKNRTRGFNL